MGLKLRIEREGDRVRVRAPAVGLWRGGPHRGHMVAPGESLGALEILGVLHPLVAPAGVRGVVLDGPSGPHARARRPVAFGEVLLELDSSAGHHRAEHAQDDAKRAASAEGLVFRAPSSGRYYGRPAPDKPPFVSVGDEVGPGQAIGLLEVMKTFTRIQYGGAGLPERARISRILPAEGDDLDQDQVMFELEQI